MHTETLKAQSTQTNQQPKPWQALPTPSKLNKTAFRLIQILASIVFLGIGFPALGMLRAEFTETFRAFPTCTAATTQADSPIVTNLA